MMPTNKISSQVPHLTTALSEPLRELEQRILDNQVQIETWLREQWEATPAAITCSVDLRHAGFKLAPVDTNLFPAGFNNLNEASLPLCVQAAQAILQGISPDCKRVLLIPESHTRNPHYFEHLVVLQNILRKAGYEVRIGSLLSELTKAREVTVPNGKLVLEPIVRDGDCIKLADFSPCLILLNNDLSEGVPDSLQHLKQTIVPASELGWASRLKSEHFSHYATVGEEFAALIDVDPWLISPGYRYCGEVDFLTGEGEKCVTQRAESLLQDIQIKYQQYDIDQAPFVVVKADAGTYGMGVMMVKTIEELQQLNRKQRQRMSSIKGGKKLTKVIIQEGIYSVETWGQAVAEPVLYLLGKYVVGGFYRVHTGKGAADNLNAPGMHFESLAFTEACNIPDKDLSPIEVSNRFYTYGVIARLAALAAARELAFIKKETHDD